MIIQLIYHFSFLYIAMLNTTTVFKYNNVFYDFDQKFIATVKPVMATAREWYKALWRDTYYSPAKSPATFFRDDFRSLKDFMWTQKFYVKCRWNLYRRDANTAEVRVAAPVYSINDNTGKIQYIQTQYKWTFSTEMLDLTPIDWFPRECDSEWLLNSILWWEEISYKDLSWLWRFGFDSTIFKALDWIQAVDSQVLSAVLWMYWTWQPYSNSYNDWYIYENGEAHLYNRNENITAPVPQTTVTTSTVRITDWQVGAAPITVGDYTGTTGATTYGERVPSIRIDNGQPYITTDNWITYVVDTGDL